MALMHLDKVRLTYCKIHVDFTIRIAQFFKAYNTYA